MSRKSIVVLVILSGLLLGVAGAARVDVPGYTKWDKSYYLTPEQLVFIRPGLNLEILAVTVDDRTVMVEFTVEDDSGQPLDLAGLFSPGPISPRFLLARIPEGEDQYENYIYRTQTSPINGNSAQQPTTDSGGSFEELAPGRYLYTFRTLLPQGYDADAIHTVGVYAERDLTEFELGEPVANALFNFIPSGADMPAGAAELLAREVVLTENCNNCHNPLALHGGARRETGLCILCHTKGVIDPDTGNTVDFKVMVHKIHRGENLPSVEAGMPYQIIGFRQSVHDYSEVVFPQDIRNCEKCHGGAEQGLAYVLRPSRAACGSCHDDVNFMSGEGHPGGPARSDLFCANCHYPEGEFEFDQSVLGAHTVPYRSQALGGLNMEILEVTNTGPGENPSVYFTLKNDADETLEPTALSRLSLTMAGPTTDYSLVIQEDARTAAPFMDGFVYTFAEAIPDDAEGTFAMSAEARWDVIVNPGTTIETSVRESLENPVVYFAVTDMEAVPRRTVVSDEKCENCHDSLMLHGSLRRDPEYCVFCHNPLANDSPFREEGLPRSIDFKLMIHRIHTGHDLTRDYTIVGFRGSLHNYNELHFPGDRRDCLTCHEGESYELPTPGVLSTPTNYEFFSPMPPTTTACLGCHDTRDAAAHAFLNIAPFGEACATCHGPGSAFAVAREHARN